MNMHAHAHVGHTLGHTLRNTLTLRHYKPKSSSSSARSAGLCSAHLGAIEIPTCSLVGVADAGGPFSRFHTALVTCDRIG